MIKLFFDQRGDPYQEKWPNFFFFKYGQITHQSIDLVELEYDLPKFFSLFLTKYGHLIIPNLVLNLNLFYRIQFASQVLNVFKF
jgi:hypothetical protein